MHRQPKNRIQTMMAAANELPSGSYANCVVVSLDHATIAALKEEPPICLRAPAYNCHGGSIDLEMRASYRH